ncbi:hypothetical protein DFR70_102853 [Nocardia tenerifensis]|uniref:Uncharacterized protein n=1 Tax=Nocardia tenerifensis TaxID=228006 RepID=A0A318K7T0_9NOCA|nr:hypothetical protein [Nocardia tenerifensis]PXX69165.1 hypothetical protein DFR70_102853 [Nocardia tenerifensis]
MSYDNIIASLRDEIETIHTELAAAEGSGDGDAVDRLHHELHTATAQVSHFEYMSYLETDREEPEEPEKQEEQEERDYEVVLRLHRHTR